MQVTFDENALDGVMLMSADVLKCSQCSCEHLEVSVSLLEMIGCVNVQAMALDGVPFGL